MSLSLSTCANKVQTDVVIVIVAVVVVAKQDSTSILQISNEITEMEKQLFCTNEPTMNVCNICKVQQTQSSSYKYIMQVTNKALYVYDANELIFSHVFVLLDTQQVKDCVISEPYVFVHTGDQRLHMYKVVVENETNVFRMVPHTYDDKAGHLVQAFSVFKDESGQFEAYSKTTMSAMSTATTTESTTRTHMLNGKKIKYEQIDEDELLYGSGTDDIDMNIEFNKNNEINNDQDDQNDRLTVTDSQQQQQQQQQPKTINETHWLCTVSQDNFFIYSLPAICSQADSDDETIELKLCFAMNKISHAPKTINNLLIDGPANPMQQTPAVVSRSSFLVNDSGHAQPNINEIALVALGEALRI